MIARTAENDCPVYSLTEELINIYSHAIGILFSAIALVLLILRAAREAAVTPIVCALIFGCSLLLLYVTSTLYHSCKNPVKRKKLRILDHATIFVLIAGTYTPFALITIQGSVGWTIFAVTWGLALVGIGLKIFFTGRFRTVSTLMYLFMGWLIIFALGPLTENLPGPGVSWLLIGGLAYSLGAVLYNIRTIPYNHPIFHCFVLLGSICHFIAVYNYALPRWLEAGGLN